MAGLQARHPGIDGALIARLARAYGTRTDEVLGDAKTAADLGTDFGAGLSQREVEYLIAHEWARTADDIVWRRSKLGLKLSADDIAALQTWIERRNSTSDDKDTGTRMQPENAVTADAADTPPAPA